MEKDGRNTFQNYNYLTETQVTLKMKELFDKNNVMFLPKNIEEKSITEISPSKTGTKQYVTTVKISYQFVDIDTGEIYEGSIEGQGSDTADKGVYKAITGGIKYVFMKTFNIPTGDDPEVDKRKPEYNKQAPQPQRYQAPAPARPIQNTPPAPKASPAQVKKLHTLCSITGANPEKIKAYYKIESMNDISASDASLTIEKLEARAQKNEDFPPATPGDIKLFDAVVTRKAKQSDRDPLELMGEYMLTAGVKTVGELSHDQITKMIDEITTTTKNNNNEVIH